MAVIGNVAVQATQPDAAVKKIQEQKTHSTSKPDFANVLKETQRNGPDFSKKAALYMRKDGFCFDENIRADSGTDFALKKLAIQYEKQILGVLWNLALSSGDKEYLGGLGEEIFHSELVNELVKSSTPTKMGDIAASIYEHLKREQDNLGSK